MYDLDRLIRRAKSGPMSYSDLRAIIQSADCDLSVATVLEVVCMSRGWDYTSLNHLYGVMIRHAEDEANSDSGVRKRKIFKNSDKPLTKNLADRRFRSER